MALKKKDAMKVAIDYAWSGIGYRQRLRLKRKK